MTAPEVTPPPASAPSAAAPKSPLALAAFIVGIVAFLLGIIPVLGLILALAGLTLGIIALVTKRGPVWMPLVGTIASGLALIASIGVLAGISTITASVTDRSPVAQVAEEETSTPEAVTPTPTAEPEEPAAPTLTMGQQQAVSKAEQYLRSVPFSRTGLIGQLEFEGFSTEDATFAVDNITVDWNEQSALKAQDYIDSMSFSRQALIDQLTFEGFTADEAEYGVTAIGY